MRIKDLTDSTLVEYVDTSAHDPAFPEDVTDRILSVTEDNFSPAATGDQLTAHINRLLGLE